MLKWRYWSVDGVDYGVVEVVELGEIAQSLLTEFGLSSLELFNSVWEVELFDVDARNGVGDNQAKRVVVGPLDTVAGDTFEDSDSFLDADINGVVGTDSTGVNDVTLDIEIRDEVAKAVPLLALGSDDEGVGADDTNGLTDTGRVASAGFDGLAQHERDGSLFVGEFGDRRHQWVPRDEKHLVDAVEVDAVCGAFEMVASDYGTGVTAMTGFVKMNGPIVIDGDVL